MNRCRESCIKLTNFHNHARVAKRRMLSVLNAKRIKQRKDAYADLLKATGKMISQIIKGRKPADIPTLFMTDPSDVDLLINKDVAKKLGVSFPNDVEKLANKVIENGRMTTK